MKPHFPPRISLCGIGGYGASYFDFLFQAMDAGDLVWTAAIDPMPEQCFRLAELEERGIPVYPSLETFYAAGRCDLTILATPIHLHASQTCLALAHGSHVLCEKPLCATVEEMERMAAAEKVSGLTVTVGYQWSFSPAVRELKKDILEGRFGAPRRLRSITCWPRDEWYYRRNRWAGRQRTEAGAWVLDSPVNNANAHHLHNMLYLLGPAVDRSVRPLNVEAELWRANPIENYDTAALRIVVEGGTELLYYASHATRDAVGPFFSFEFERGTVEFGSSAALLATFHDGAKRNYGTLSDASEGKIAEALEAVRTGRRPVCGIAAAGAHTLCVNQAQAFPIGDFAPSRIRADSTGKTLHRHVEGLQEALLLSYKRGLLLSEVDSSFSKPSNAVPLLSP